MWNSWCSQAGQQPQPSCLAVQTVDPRSRAGLQGMYTHMYVYVFTCTRVYVFMVMQVLPLRARLSFSCLPENSRTTQDRLFSSLLSPAEVKDVIHTAD